MSQISDKEIHVMLLNVQSTTALFDLLFDFMCYLCSIYASTALQLLPMHA
jgi:hypothetical protein